MERNRDPQKRYSESVKSQALYLYKEAGYTLEEISKILGTSKSTIWRWINNFADENTKEKKPMYASQPQGADKKSSQNLNDLAKNEGEVLSSGGNTDSILTETCSMAEELAKLRQQLQKEKLRADAYEEMINVAESKFNIAIRKKAGAKQ